MSVKDTLYFKIPNVMSLIGLCPQHLFSFLLLVHPPKCSVMKWIGMVLWLFLFCVFGFRHCYCEVLQGDILITYRLHLMLWYVWWQMCTATFQLLDIELSMDPTQCEADMLSIAELPLGRKLSPQSAAFRLASLARLFLPWLI